MSARNTILFWATLVGTGATTLTVPEVRCGVGLDTPETDRRCEERTGPKPPLSTHRPWPEPRPASATPPRERAHPPAPDAHEEALPATREFGELPTTPPSPEMRPGEERIQPRPEEGAPVRASRSVESVDAFRHPRSTEFRDTLRYPRSTEFGDTIRLDAGW